MIYWLFIKISKNENPFKDFLATGRVKFYSLCEYVGDNKFKSLVENGLEYEVSVRKKTVDSTYMDVR